MPTLLARDIMTKNVQYADLNDHVPTIAKIMARNAISAVPVCENHKVVGIISEGDLMRPFTKKKQIQRDWWLSLLAEGTELSSEFMNYIDQNNLTAKQLMNTKVITATPETPISEIAQMLDENHIKRVPIIQDEKMVGIVSRADLIRAYARGQR